MSVLKRGLFINNKKAKDSIYESGCMVYNCLITSKNFSIDYCEVSKAERNIAGGYDFYLFNYHLVTMGWLDTKKLKNIFGKVGSVILEVAPNDPFVLTPSKDFSFYCVLDPTIKPKENLFVFPRPLDVYSGTLPLSENRIPVIGTFGFATQGKGFQHVVEAVNKEFDKAIVNINIPFGDFIPESKTYAAFLAETCIAKAKPGVKVNVTHDFLSKNDLIKWCAGNTLNCFFYDRDMPGLSATTDQAIISGRPLAVSQNDTFRHILAYLQPYPAQSLKESIQNSLPKVMQMKEDWRTENFIEAFEKLLSSLNIYEAKIVSASTIELPLLKNKALHFLNLKVKRYKRKIKKLTFKSILTYYDHKRSKKII